MPPTPQGFARAKSSIKRALQLSTSDAMFSVPLVGWIIVFGTGVTSLPHVGAFDSWSKAAIAGALSVVLMFAALYLVWFLVLRHIKRTPIRIVATLIVYLCAGAFRGLTLSWLLTSVMEVQLVPDAALYRMSANATRMSMFLVLGVYVVAVTRSQRARLAQVTTKRSQVEAMLDAARNNDLDQQTSALNEVSNRLDREITSRQHNPEQSSRTLETLASDVIRPVSIELARRMPQYDVPKISDDDFVVPLRRFLLQINLPRFISPLYSILVLGLAWSGTALIVFGISSSLLMYLVFFPAQCVLLACIRTVFTRLDSWPKLLSLALGIILVIVATLGPLLVVTAIFPNISTRTDVMVAIVIQASEFIWFVATVFAVRHQRAVAEQHFDMYSRQLEWLEARARLESWSLDNRLAQILHGPALAQLYSTVQEIEAQPDFTVNINTYLDDFSESLKERLLSALSPDDSVTLTNSVRSVTNFWSDDCAITFNQDETCANSLARDPLATELITGIIQNAVSFAVVDAKATMINIELTMPDDDLVQLIIIDNGQSTKIEPEDSTSSTQLRVCTLNWQRRSENGHTILTALVPVTSLAS